MNSKNSSQSVGVSSGAFLLICGSIIVAFHETLLSLIRVWQTSSDFSHGFLIFPIAIWLIWQQRQSLASIPKAPSYWGLFVIAFSALAWIAGELAGVSSARQFGLVGMILGAFVGSFGLTLSKRLAFPLLFCFFAVPFGESLNPLLMQYTADATIWAVRASGIPLYREGMQFVLPTGTWSVVEACSGLRYLIAALVLGTVFSYINFRSWTHRLTFLAATVFVAVVSNWLRAYTVVMVGHFSNMKYGTGDDHVWYGWVFFGVVMAIVFTLGMKFSPAPNSGPELEPNEVDLPPVQMPTKLAKVIGSVLIGLGILLAASTLPLQLRNFPLLSAESLQAVQKGSASDATFPLPPNIEGAIHTGASRLASGSHLAFSYYGRMHENKDPLAFGNSVFPKSEAFNRLEQYSLPQALNPIEGRKAFTVRLGNRYYLYTFWFKSSAAETQSPQTTKLAKFLSVATGQGDHTLLVLLALPIDGHQVSTEQLAIFTADVTEIRKRVDLVFDPSGSVSR